MFDVVIFRIPATRLPPPPPPQHTHTLYSYIIAAKLKSCFLLVQEIRPIQQTNALSVTWPTVGQQKTSCVLPSIEFFSVLLLTILILVLLKTHPLILFQEMIKQ